MTEHSNPVKRVIENAIDQGRALEAGDVRMLRSRSKQAALAYKGVFWGGIVVFNLALWAPLPFEISRSVLYLIALVSLVVAIVVPIIGLRKHQMNLELLKVASQQPKRKTASDKGRVYIDQVRQQDRPFVNAEYELLEGSKWASSTDNSAR
jgi:hypothetical protein